MSIIFRTAINKNFQLYLFYTTIILFLVQVDTRECQPFHFKTQYTRCTISLNQCTTFGSTNQHNGDPTFYEFKSCQLEKCVTLGAGPDCHSYITM